MSKIVSIHSFRGGTGKSNLTANLATLVAASGMRVGIVDTDIQSPGIHALFGFDEDQITRSLNDYLWGRCPIEETAHDVSSVLAPASNGTSRQAVFLIPSSLKTGEIARVLREGYDVSRLNDGFRDLIERLELDYLFIDTHPGVNEETLLSIAISNVLVIVLRADQQDYQGTAVTVELARKLEVPRMLMVVNKVLPAMDFASVKEKVEAAYGAPVAGILPLSEDMVRIASGSLFCLRLPDHSLSEVVRSVKDQIVG